MHLCKCCFEILLDAFMDAFFDSRLNDVTDECFLNPNYSRVCFSY